MQRLNKLCKSRLDFKHECDRTILNVAVRHSARRYLPRVMQVNVKNGTLKMIRAEDMVTYHSLRRIKFMKNFD